MASSDQHYSSQIPSDLAEEVEDKRYGVNPNDGEAVSKSEAVERGLKLWVEQPTWRDHALNAAVNLSMLAMVAFVTGETTRVLTTAEAAMLAWVLLSVAASSVAFVEFASVLRSWGVARGNIWRIIRGVR